MALLHPPMGKMRLAVLLIVSLAGMQPVVLRAQAIVPPADGGQEMARLRLELIAAQSARRQAAQDKSRAYREAHILYKNCDKELRVFCMLSAQTLIRDADFLFKYRESREFSDIAALEAAIAERERKARMVAPTE